MILLEVYDKLINMDNVTEVHKHHHYKHSTTIYYVGGSSTVLDFISEEERNEFYDSIIKNYGVKEKLH